MSALSLTEVKGEPRVDTRLLAGELKNQHKAVITLIERYEQRFKRLGKLPFEMEALPSGQRARYALLNEDQCYFLLSLSRNTDHVVDLKMKLVVSFKEARDGRRSNAIEYLPGYHQLHDIVHDLASRSSNERAVHMNFNKLVNKTVGIGSGQRRTIATPTKSAIVVAQSLAIRAMAAANDHHDGYQAAKKALGNFELLLLGRQA